MLKKQTNRPVAAEATSKQAGFSLPTIIILGVILLGLGVTFLSIYSSIQSAIRIQVYNQFAREAAQSGISYANYCLKASNGTQTWGSYSSAPNLGPNTDCFGQGNGGSANVLSTSTITSSYNVSDVGVGNDGRRMITATGTATVNLNGIATNSYTATQSQPYGDRQSCTNVTNLFSNPGFNTMQGVGWSTPGGVNIYNGNDPSAFNGNGFVRASFTGTGGGGIYLSRTPSDLLVTAGKVYTFSAYVRSNRVGAFIGPRVEWTLIDGSTNVGVNQTAGVQLRGGWNRISITATAPVGAVRAVPTYYLTDGNWNNGDYEDIDAAMATEGSTLYAFSDGDSPGWRWNGTRDISSSTGPTGVNGVNQAACTPIRNVLLNPGGEYDYSNGTYYNPAFSIDTSQRVSGASSVKVVTNGQYLEGYIWGSATVPGGTYTCSVYLKTDTPQTVSIGGRVLDTNGNYLYENAGGTSYYVTNTWQRFSITFNTFDDGRGDLAVKPNLQFRQDNGVNNTTFWADNAMCTAGNTLYSYLDGSQGWTWNFEGAWFNSPSRGIAFSNYWDERWMNSKLNMLTNPNAENTSVSTAGMAYQGTSVGSNAVSYDTTTSVSGLNSFTRTSVNTAEGFIWTIDQNQSPGAFTCSVYLKASVPVNAIISGRLLGTGNNYLSEGSGARTVSVSTNWQRYSITQTFDSPASARPSLQAVFQYLPTGAKMWADAAMCTPGYQVYPFASGDTRDWTWSGQSNNSSSFGPQDVIDPQDQTTNTWKRSPNVLGQYYNLLANPGAEIDPNTAAINGNGPYTYNDATPISQSQDFVHSGKYSYKVVPSTSYSGLLFNSISTTAGNTYTYSAWVYSQNAQYVNLAGDGLGVAQDFLIPANTWTRISVSGQKSSSNNSFFVRSTSTSTPLPFYVDDIMLSDGANRLLQYADGSSSGWRWAGAPGNSISFGPGYLQ